MILRQQLAVLQRRQPRRPNLNWADRALLAALLSAMPNAHSYGLGLLVTPDTILRWHRDIVRRRWAARSMHAKTGRPAHRVKFMIRDRGSNFTTAFDTVLADADVQTVLCTSGRPA